MSMLWAPFSAGSRLEERLRKERGTDLVPERSMKIVTYLLLGVLLFAIFRTNRSVKECRSEKERTFVIRTTALTWLVGFVFLAALLFLPNKARVMMMLPGFFLVVSLGKAWRDSRTRLRQDQAKRVDIEKMKRVN